MQRRLAIGLGLKIDPAHVEAQFDKVVDFAVGDQGRVFLALIFSLILSLAGGGHKWLIAGFQIDDGQARLYQADAAGNGDALAVRPPVRHGVDQRLQRFAIGSIA